MESDAILATPIELPSAPEVISRELRRDIARGVYKPGPIRIRSIAERFGVSATPVREALQRLEAEGLITMRRNQILVNALSEEELREIFTIRAELEAFALLRSRDRIESDPSVLDDLESFIAEMDRYEQDPEEWRIANERFHMGIYQLADMPRLESMIRSLWITVEPYLRRYVLTAAGSLRTAQNEHRAMLAGLRQGDFDEAAQILRRHLWGTEEIVAAGLNNSGQE